MSFTTLVIIVLIAISISSIAFTLDLFYKNRKLKEKKANEIIDFSSLNYGRIKQTVSYRTYSQWNNTGEKITRTVTAKIRFKESLGNDKIKVQYIDVLNMSSKDEVSCLRNLNTYHDMVSYNDVGWITYNGNGDIVLSKREFFGLIG